jgi:hypothetical protein
VTRIPGQKIFKHAMLSYCMMSAINIALEKNLTNRYVTEMKQIDKANVFISALLEFS